MSRKYGIVLLGMAVAIFFCSAMMAKDNAMGIADKQTISFTAPTLVGGALLPAGNYNITHQMSGETHIMIFHQVGGKAEAKANCNLVPLKNKAPRTEQRYTTNADNQRVLKEMTFEGDKATHILVQ